MYSVISTLDPNASEAIKSLRDRLEDRCKSLSKALVLEPHMSWLGAEGGNLPEIAEHLTQLGDSLHPLHLETAGFGIFPGTTPVLYLPVISTKALLNIHNQLWKKLAADIVQVSLHYKPDQWLPHITVFYVDEKSARDMGCAIGDLLLDDFHLEFSIDQFKLAYFQDDHYGYYSTHSFS